MQRKGQGGRDSAGPGACEGRSDGWGMPGAPVPVIRSDRELLLDKHAAGARPFVPE